MMRDQAAIYAVFGTIVLLVVSVGVVGALVIALGRDTFARGRGEFWMFHGDPDTSPHQMPGTRFEERHVIDPVDERPLTSRSANEP